MSDPPGDEQQPPAWQQPQWQQPQWGQQQQPPPQWQQPQPPYYYQPGPPTPGKAVAALILGICALLFCAPICGPLAIIYGIKARREIDAAAGRLNGRGLGTAGVIMGWIGVAITIIGIAGIIALVAAYDNT